MRFSGYSLEEIIAITEDGLSKYYAKRKNREKFQFRYRSSMETLRDRERKDLIGKTTWYKEFGKQTEGQAPITVGKLGGPGRKALGREA